MQISQAGIEFIKKFEGLRLDAYQDQAGVWTVGYGTTGPNIGPKTSISLDEANRLFKGSLVFFEKAVTEGVLVPLNQNEFDALVSFTYNVGASAFYKSTLRRLLNNNDSRSIVASEFLRWTKVGDGKVSEGLKRRREAEKQLFLSKPLKASLAHSIVAQRDTWLKRKPEQAASLPAEEKLFVPKGSAHVWAEIAMVPGETDYKVTLEAQPDKPWWFYPSHWKIINDSKPQPVSPYVHPTKLVLDVPYYSQRDNRKDPLRTCFSSSCAMMLKALKPNSIKNDDEYINAVYRHGDTVSASAQLAALADYGVNADFLQTGGWSDIDSQLTLGIPVPIGILHKGHVTNPTGGGHWIVIIGRSEDNKSYVVHDPFGDLDLVGGTYISSNGKALLYSKKNLGPRWKVESGNSGWFIKGYKK